MSKHTNGPWEVVRTDAGIIVRTESVKKTRAGASRYAAIGGFDRSDPEQLAEALSNASLIAAAPELLSDLIDAMDMLKTLEAHGVPVSKSGRAAMNRYLATIAKATEGLCATDERTQHSWS